MRVQIKLFSVLREYVSGYDPQRGVSADLPAGATVSDMLSHLGIPMSKAPVVICNGRILRSTDTIQPDSTLGIFQPVGGG
jgi:sulfur carrier protein ThiS